jgi:hypothetical protein
MRSWHAAGDELHIALGVEDFVLRPENKAAYAPYFGVLLHTFYDMEVASEFAVSGASHVCLKPWIIIECTV